MKKITKLLPCIVLLFSIISMPNPMKNTLADEQGQDWNEIEVPNGDFESPFSNDEVPEWTYWNGGYKEGMTVSQNKIFEGSQSLYVNNTGVVGLSSRDIDVTGNNRYMVTAQLYPEAIDGKPGIWLRWLDDEGKIIENTPKYFEDLKLDEWNKVSVEGVAPAEAAAARIFIYQSSTSTMDGYYDNIQLFEQSGSQTVDLQNASFEKPLENGKIPDWTTYPSTLRPDTSIELVDTQSVDGQNSVKIVDNTSSSSVGLYSQAFQVVPDKVYIIEGKANIQSGGIGVYLKYYDTSGKEVGSYSARYDAALDTWIDISVEGKAPENAVSAKIFLYQGVAGISTAYYDSFSASIKQQLDLPFEFGDPINLGPATLAAKAQGVAMGNGEVYFATNGSPATFYAVDAYTGEVTFSQSVPGNDVVWAVTVGADGNVYFSGTYNGILYRYSPEQKQIESIGTNPSDDWVWELESTADGKIYGATYPNAKVFEYDIYSNEFRDLGRISEEEKYARGLGVTEQNIYVGIGTTAHLYKINRDTGEKTEIELPITGAQTSVSNIWEYNGQLFVAYGTSMIIMDVETGEVLKQMDWQDEHTFDGQLSPPSPYNENLIYYRDKRTSTLWTYNLETHETSAVEPTIELPGSSAKGYKWITKEDGSKVLAILHNQIEYALYDPQTNTLEKLYPNVELQGLAIQSLEIGEDDDVYMGGYQGSIGVYDTSEETYILHERDPHQIEGIGFLNGDVYMGAYGGARIYKYDPEQPYQFTGETDDNPAMVYDIGDEQSRPFTFASGDDMLFTGTIPDYGELGGALTIYDSITNDWSTIRNIIEDQGIIGLAYKDGRVFGGSTIAGGLGIDPVATEAKMFEYNVEVGSHEVFDLHVEGIERPEMIGELSFGPDGNLWGTAYGYKANGIETYAIFAMDPDSREVVKSTLMYEGISRGSQWRPFFMRWDENGYLYTTVARKVTIIDPETMQSKQILGNTVNLMDVDQEGNIYYSQGENLFKLPVTLDTAELTAEKETVLQGEELQLGLHLTLTNGKTADLNGADIEWFVSDGNVAEVVDGNLIAKNGGTMNISAAITYNGQTIKTDPLTVTITVSTASLTSQIERMEQDGELLHPTAQQLIYSLNQVQHHHDKGDVEQTQFHLDNFKKHLDRSEADNDIKTILVNNLNLLFQEESE